MILSGNYIGRSGGFLSSAFVKDALTELNGESTNAEGLYRLALEHGAQESSSQVLMKKLREGLSSAALNESFIRHRIKGRKGYFFKAKMITQSNKAA